MYKAKNPASIMMLGVVGSDGTKMPPYFFEKTSDGGGINQDTYIKVMEEVVYPWIQRTYEELDIAYIWQQDGAPAHTGSMTQAWLEDNVEDFFD